jgi:hypothetical protein
LAQGWREIKARTCGFFWGFLSILLVCTVVAVVFSVSRILPVIILMLAENLKGEVDLRMVAGEWTGDRVLNYTLIEESFRDVDSKYKRLTPRIEYGSKSYFGKNSFQSDLFAFDTLAERNYEIGRAWDFNPPGVGEAYISSSLARQLNVLNFRY